MKTNWDKHWEGFEISLSSPLYYFFIRRSYANFLGHIQKESPSILELGSGSARNSLFMAGEVGAGKVTLVDSNQRALDISKDIMSDVDFEVNFVKDDVLDLDLDESFDIVHSAGLVEHFFGEDRKQIFRQHSEYCKDNGYVIIFTPFKKTSYKLFKKTLQLFDKWIYDERPFSEEELQKICGECSFEVIEKEKPLLLHQIGVLLDPIS